MNMDVLIFLSVLIILVANVYYLFLEFNHKRSSFRDDLEIVVLADFLLIVGLVFKIPIAISFGLSINFISYAVFIACFIFWSGEEK